MFREADMYEQGPSQRRRVRLENLGIGDFIFHDGFVWELGGCGRFNGNGLNGNSFLLFHRHDAEGKFFHVSLEMTPGASALLDKSFSERFPRRFPTQQRGV